MLRKSVVAALAALLVLGVAVAYAQSGTVGNSTFEVDATIAPQKSGTKKKPKAGTFNLNMKGGTKDNQGQASTSKQLVITLPTEWVVNTKIWPKKARCKDKTTNDRADCPKASKVGKGHVTALGGGGSIVEEIDVKAYALKSGNLGLFIRADKPVRFALMLVGKIQRNKIVVNIPNNVQEPVAGIPTAIKNLRFSLKKTAKIKGKTRGILETKGCARNSWVVGVKNVYRDGSLSDSDKLACR